MSSGVRAAAAWLIAAAVAIPALPARAQSASYRIEPQPKTAAELTRRFAPAQIEVLEMLNRRDRQHLLRADPPVPGIVVPDAWSADPLVYSPFPREWPAAAQQAKAIVVYQRLQAFGAYENGRLVRWGPVSTGRKETPTPEGQFNLTWRARSRRSTDNEDWLLEWYFNFVNARGVSFHLFDLPGYPASHACVRLLLRDAQWLYGWGDQWTLDETRRRVASPGTTVVIVGGYAFGSPAPWLAVEHLAEPIVLPPLPATTGLAPTSASAGVRADSDRSASPDSQRRLRPTTPALRSETYTRRPAPYAPALPLTR